MARMALAADLEWLERWLLAGRRARRAVDDVLDGWGGLSGLHVARSVARAQQALPSDGPNLLLGASSVVRDLDLVMDHGVDQPLVHASRGLSGIDGSLSTAAGIALARATPVRALVGDLTFLHDTNGLLVGPTEERPPVQVVLSNDAGGSIFSLLEHGEQRFAGVHERFFATPQDVDVAALCRAHHVPHRLVSTEAELDAELAGWDGSSQVVECAVDRSRARELSRTVAEAARRAAAG
jgi:2-succinyl-5-enolpyruvyl-6-hydroxy-3-cyclohexene-1-carboxylate synthase